jgi:hypothetical protein
VSSTAARWTMNGETVVHAAHAQSEAVKRFEAAYGPELVSKGVTFTDYRLIASKGP